MRIYHIYKDLKQKYKEGFELIVFGGIAFILISACVIYLYYHAPEKLDGADWIGAICLEVFIILAILFGVVLCYKKKHPVKRSQKTILQNSSEYDKKYKRNKIQKEYIKKHKNMYEEYRWFSIGVNTRFLPIILIIGVLFFVICREKYNDVPIEVHYISCAGAMLLILGYYVKIVLGKPSKALKKYIKLNGFSEQMVNEDFMKGRIFVAFTAMVCVGYEYIVYIREDSQFVVRLSDILEANMCDKQISLNGSEMVQKRVQLFHADNSIYSYQTDKIGGQLLLEELERHGVKVDWGEESFKDKNER